MLSVVLLVKVAICQLPYIWKCNVETGAAVLTDAFSRSSLEIGKSRFLFTKSLHSGTTKSSLLRLAASLSSNPTSATKSRATSSKSLHSILQQSFSIHDILQNVACHITPNQDPNGFLSCLILVRLSKYMITDDNHRQTKNTTETTTTRTSLLLLKKGLMNTVHSFTHVRWADTPSSLESAVEGIKAVAVMTRILARSQPQECIPLKELCAPLCDKLHLEAKEMISMLQPHHLSGLQWAIDCFQCAAATHEKKYLTFPQILQESYEALQLPFRIRPGFLLNSPVIVFANSSVHDVMSEFAHQIDFQSDVIKTTSTNRSVHERRQTAWQGDDTVAAFSYSGKSMTRKAWSPLVKTIRHSLYETTSQFYDGCLLNLYPDGESGMRYHSDPDQGTDWGYETAVVSIGATRKIAFRTINDATMLGVKPHVFVLFHGDVTEMFRDCQSQYQHAIKTTEAKQDISPRISLVFKKTLKSTRSINKLLVQQAVDDCF
jgi:alkylated DNA repair dioxygenase AlkB